MRPPEFTGGNSQSATRPGRSLSRSRASMRPPEFTGGNRGAELDNDQLINVTWGFNEAAGIHRRKP